jgi:hypothetical protein
MTPIDQLILDAEQKRDAAIHQAHVDYNSAVREIRHLAEKLKRIYWQGQVSPGCLAPSPCRRSVPGNDHDPSRLRAAE